MDPQKALDTWLEAALAGDYVTARVHAEALVGWLNRGGFRPVAEPIIWDLFAVYCKRMET